MLTLSDVIISGHKENKLRQFYFTILVKEEDINLNEKEFIREACRNGLAFDITIVPSEHSTKAAQVEGELYNVDQATGEVK